MTEPDARRPLILVVDDNDVNRQLARDGLADRGWDLIEADSGSAGLVLIDRCRPDVVVLDIMMPDIDGIQVLRLLRSRGPSLARTQVIAMTSLAMPRDRERCLAAGADDYLRRPCSLKSLRERVAAALVRAGVGLDVPTT